MTDAHLTNAARALEAILRAKHPGRRFVVSIDPQRPDTRRDASTTPRNVQPGTVGDDLDALAERRTRTAAAATADDHDLKQAS